jgi:hypothetical protein
MSSVSTSDYASRAWRIGNSQLESKSYASSRRSKPLLGYGYMTAHMAALFTVRFVINLIPRTRDPISR